jgi:iron complex transport system substrate-binding protein
MSRTPSFVVLIIGIALAGILAACAPAASVSTPALTQPAATAVPPTAAVAAQPTKAAAPASAVYPLMLKDDLGREAKIAQQPKRIVSLAPSITEILFAVGAGPQVVGVTKYCNYPPEASQGREIVGGFSAKSLSVEKIISLKPDLVFAAGATHKPVSDALEAAGVSVFNFDPKDLAGVYTNIVAAGAITGNAAQAEQVVAGMKARVEKVAATVATIPQAQRVKVFYEVWDEPLTTAGPDTFIGQVIQTAGGVNLYADVKEQYPVVSVETVVERNPDVILGPSSHGEGMTGEKISARAGWKGIKAVQNGRVTIIDGDIISRAGPRLADALEAVARGIYPDRFK